MQADIMKTLKLSSLGNGLNEEQLSRLVGSSVMTVKSYKRNDILFWTDKAPDKLYILMRGNIAMAKDTLSGKRSLSKSIQAQGDLTGEVRLFSPKKLLWEYAVAIEDTTVLAIDSRIFLQHGAIDADIQMVLLHNIIANVVDKIDYLGQKVRILSMPSVRERIAFYMLNIQDASRRMILKSTREEIADYLGIARPSLSRELGRMQDDGIIQIDGHEIKLLDQSAFDELIE